MSKKSVTKKQILFLGLVVALGAAMYVNWYYTKPASERNNALVKEEVTEQENLGEAQYVSAEGKKSFFDEAALKRSKAHAAAQELSEKVISNKDADEESKKEARENLNKLTENMQKESDIESLIDAKIGAKSLVLIDDTVEVVVEKGKLNADSALQIKEIVVNKTKISSEKITLVEVK